MRTKMKAIKNIKTMGTKGLSVFLMMIMLFGMFPQSIFADGVNHPNGITIIPPIASTNLIGNQPAIFVDFSVWEMEIDNIEIEVAPDYSQTSYFYTIQVYFLCHPNVMLKYLQILLKIFQNLQ